MMGRKPANRTIELEPLRTASGYISGYFEYNNLKKPVYNIEKDLKNQCFSSGNRIGHDPKKPKQFVSPQNHRRPPSLSEVIRDFNESNLEAKLYKRLYYHLDKNGTPARLIRSEFREMISTGCAILTHYYDVLTGEIGFRNEKGKHIRLSYESIAELLKVSLIRVKRFFGFLKDRGLVQIIQDKSKDETGQWKSNISRKIISPRFFIDTLGIAAWKKITSLKEWLIKKVKPKTKHEQRNRLMLTDIMKSGAIMAKPKTAAPKNDTNPEMESKLVRMAMEAYELDRSRPPSDYLREIKEKLKVKSAE